MDRLLTEEIIRERASEQSYQRGKKYFLSDAIFKRRYQLIPNGVLLTALCEGSSAPSYRLSVELDAGGIRSTSCTCPYDLGGDCKHIVALLLDYHNQPEAFSEQKSAADLLSGMDKDALTTLLLRLIERNPDLYDDIEKAIPVVKATTLPKLLDPNQKGETQVSEQTYRELVKQILRQRTYEDDSEEYDDYGGYDYYDEDENPPAFLSSLEEIWQTANQLQESGDSAGAMIILRVLLEEIVNEFDSEIDQSGGLASLIESLGIAVVETILTSEPDDNTRKELQETVAEILKKLDESVDDLDLKVIPIAMEYGWKELPNPGTHQNQYDEETWKLFDMLERSRLNILDRQGKIDEFLQLAKKRDTNRYIFKLLQLERMDEAIAASQNLTNEYHVLSIAQKLRAAGRLDDAINLAERCLQQSDSHNIELAKWLAPLEEAKGNTDMALLSYRIAFAAAPSLTLYRRVKQLSGKNWEALRPEMREKVFPKLSTDLIIDLYLEEHEWDMAISIAEKSLWNDSLLEKVANGVIQYRPDWVIRISILQAEQLIDTVQSSHYPTAARWLSRAKQAYLAQGNLVQWQTYINQLRVRYTRRPSLQHAIAGL